MDDCKKVDAFSRFSWPEFQVAKALGVAFESVGALRDEFLHADTDWKKKRHAVHWTHDALRKVALALDLGDLPALQEPPADASAKVVRTLVVSPKKTLNPHILLALDGLNVFRVRVKTKENFRAGMQIRCILVEADLYTIDGNHPRYPGRY